MLTMPSYTLFADSLLEPSGWSELVFSVVSFAAIFCVLSVVFYLAGNVVVGRKKASFKDAFAISVFGTLVLIVCLSVFSLDVATILSLIAWLLLVRYYYETGILGSITVGLVSVAISIAVLVVLNTVFGYSMIFSWLPVL